MRRLIGKAQEQTRYGACRSRLLSTIGAAISECGCAQSPNAASLQQALDDVNVQGHDLDTAYASFLRQCGDSGVVDDVKLVHRHAIQKGRDTGTFVGNVLVQSYGKCGDLLASQAAFDKILERNVYSWNIAIGAYAQNGHFEKALHLFYDMEREGTTPNRVTFLAALGACSNIGDPEEAKKLHARIAQCNLQGDIKVCNALINVYGKCGSVADARQIFDTMPSKNVISWTSMITAYTQEGRYPAEALDLFSRMDILPTDVTFMSVLEACSQLGDLETGRRIHAAIVANGLESLVWAGKSLGNTLVDMYGKCGDLEHAKAVFDRMQYRDVVAWNALLAAYARQGCSRQAFSIFHLMDLEGVKPNDITYTSVISACSNKHLLQEGQRLHQRVTASGVGLDAILQNSFITMYSRCGSLEAARSAFQTMPRRNTTSWNTIIGAFIQHGHMDEALRLFSDMDVPRNEVTFVTVLGACCDAQFLAAGAAIHRLSVAANCDQDPVVGSALVNMYSKCGSLEDAKNVFECLKWKTVISWTAMIEAYVQYGRGRDSLKLFERMEMEGWKANDITYISILGACSAIGAFTQGKAIHARIIAAGPESDVIRIALVNLYGRCGKVEEAIELFQKLQTKAVVAWNAMISAFAQQGYGVRALSLFYRMSLEGGDPNEITFMSVLYACSHEGLFNKSWDFFRSMSSDHQITPAAEHYGTMVDLLARQGHLQKAEDLINTMPFHADVVAWTSLLGGCKTHSDPERGARVATEVMELGKQKSAPYSLLTNIYAEAGKLDEAHRTCKLMESRGARRQAARSFIEVNNRIHDFVVGDTTHPQNQQIRAELQRLYLLMKEGGYQPDKQVVLHAVDESEKELMLMYHSERLALAFGLINNPAGNSIHIVKNIRVCSDCHTAIKLISKIVQRKIVLRDGSRFHHFQEGSCSCKDYW